MGIVLPYGRPQRVDASVASDKNATVGLDLVKEVSSTRLGRSEVPVAYVINRLTVELFRPRACQVACTQTRLDMSHRDLQIKRRQGSRKGCRCVAMDKNSVGTFTLSG